MKPHSMKLNDVIDALYQVIDLESNIHDIYLDRGSLDCFASTGIPLSGADLLMEEQKPPFSPSCWNGEIDEDETYYEYYFDVSGIGPLYDVTHLAEQLDSENYNEYLKSQGLEYCWPGISASAMDLTTDTDDEEVGGINVTVYFLAIAE